MLKTREEAREDGEIEKNIQPDSKILGWKGNLELVYGNHQEQTKLLHAHTKAPLKVQSPFYPEGKKVCHTVLLHTAGGIVGGDRLSQRIHLTPQSHVLLTTAAASKIYRSNGHQAQQTISLKVDADACLEWLPQDTILFNGAVYQQNLRVELAVNSSWLGWEIIRFGRSARGEKFVQGEWRSQTEVWQQGVPIWIDRQWLPGGEDTFNSANGLGGYPLVGSLVWIGQPVSSELVEKVRLLWHNQEHQGQAGVTTTQNQGLLCRYRGSSTAEVRQWFWAVWNLLRMTYLQRRGIKSRIWNF